MQVITLCLLLRNICFVGVKKKKEREMLFKAFCHLNKGQKTISHNSQCRQHCRRMISDPCVSPSLSSLTRICCRSAFVHKHLLLCCFHSCFINACCHPDFSLYSLHSLYCSAIQILPHAVQFHIMACLFLFNYPFLLTYLHLLPFFSTKSKTM